MSQIEFRQLEEKKIEMKHLFLAFLLMQILSCSKKPETLVQKLANPTPATSPSPTLTSKGEEKNADDFVTKDEQQTYDGYDIFKQKKTVVEYDTKIEIPSVILKKGGKIVASFPGMIHPHSEIDFGLFSFLNNGQKQLIISASEPRGGNQWLAELSPTYREIFSTITWRVGREGADLGFVDLDKDGVYEITTGDFWYYVFDEISMSETPVITVVFRYDKKAGKYLPANHLFPAYSLAGIDARIAAFPPHEGYNYLGARVDVLLHYLYAGKEKKKKAGNFSTALIRPKTKCK